MSDNSCPHFGLATPPDFDCTGCTVAKKCYQKWLKAYETTVENCLSGLISYTEANEKLAKLGCEVPDNVL